MRLRNIPKANDYLLSSEYVENSPFSKKGHWYKSFANNNPIYLEVGCGKGQFLIQSSFQNPQSNFIGLELYASVLYKALLKLNRFSQNNISNLLFIHQNAKDLTDIFDVQEINGIYLNFSDPWPKKRHANRRLTSSVFLEKYHVILKDAGFIEFKTDNENLFQFSVDSFKESPLFSLTHVITDLHHDELHNQNNIMTEYEERFSAYGHPIYKLIAKKIS